jgi:hypothetical protein
MKLNLNCTLVLILVILAFTACQKDSSTETLLTEGSWITESKMATIQGTIINLNDSIHPCVQDDLTRFLIDGSVEIDDNILKCYPGDPQTFSLGPWILSEKDTKLFYGGTTYDIEELSASGLKLSGPYSNLGIAGTIEITFIK